MLFTPEVVNHLRNNLIITGIIIIVYISYRNFKINEVYYALSVLEPYAAKFNALPKTNRVIIAVTKYEYPEWEVNELMGV